MATISTLDAKYLASCEDVVNGYNLATRKKTARYIIDNSILYSANEIAMAKAILR